MKVKILDVVNVAESSRNIKEELSRLGDKISPRLSFRISKIISTCVSEYSSNIFQVKMALFEKYGTKIEDTNDYIIPEENRNKFLNEWNELTSELVSLDVNPINLSELEKSNVPYSVVDILSPFIVEE